MNSTEIIKDAENKLNEIYTSHLSFDELLDSEIMSDAISSTEYDDNKIDVDFGDYMLILKKSEKSCKNYINSKGNTDLKILNIVSLFLTDNEGDYDSFSTEMRVVHVKDKLHLIR